MNDNITLTNLLAHRDGEPLDLAVTQEIESEVAAREKLSQLRSIKHALNALPPLTPDAQVDEHWFAAQRDAENRGSAQSSARVRWRLSQHPIAVAATVFVVVTATFIAWFPGSSAPGARMPMSMVDVPAEETVAIETQDLQLAELVARSQHLEDEVLIPAANSFVAGNLSRRASQSALLYRIADIDSELSRVLEEERMDAALRERLWQQRVDLLESLLEVRRARDANVPSAMY